MQNGLHVENLNLTKYLCLCMVVDIIEVQLLQLVQP